MRSACVKSELDATRRGGGRAAGGRVSPIRPDLKTCKVGRRPLNRDVGYKLPLKHRANEKHAIGSGLEADAIGHQRAFASRGKHRCVVSRLVRVGEQDDIRTFGVNDLGQGAHEPIRRVGLQRRVIDHEHLRDIGCRHLISDRRYGGTDHDHLDWTGTLRGHLLSGRHGLPGDPIHHASSLFSNDQNHRSPVSARSEDPRILPKHSYQLLRCLGR